MEISLHVWWFLKPCTVELLSCFDTVECEARDVVTRATWGKLCATSRTSKHNVQIFQAVPWRSFFPLFVYPIAKIILDFSRVCHMRIVSCIVTAFSRSQQWSKKEGEKRVDESIHHYCKYWQISIDDIFLQWKKCETGVITASCWRKMNYPNATRKISIQR